MKITGGLVLLGVGFLMGLMLCSKCTKEHDPGVRTVIKTEVRYDTVYQTIIQETVKEKPVPYYVQVPTIPIPEEIAMIRSYKDSVFHNDVTIYYEATTLGFLEEIRIKSINRKETITKTITNDVITTVRKPVRGLFVGVGVGASKETFTSIEPQLSYVSRVNIISAGYNVLDQSVNLRVSRKIL